MRIALDTGPMKSDSAIRGIGVYSTKLFEALNKLSTDKKIEVALVDVKKYKDLKKSFDLVHYPQFDLFFHTLPMIKKIPTVLTIHDTIPLLYPKYYPVGVRGSYNFTLQKISLRTVKHIITDSETSKKDIVRNLSISSDRITPIYLGPSVTKEYYSLSKGKNIVNKYNLPERYAIYVGDINWNKNVINLVEACINKKIHLVIVGKNATNLEYDKAHIENRPRYILQTKYSRNKYIHSLGYVPEEELPNLLKMSDCLCQVSLYEGFGLSVLDAMTLGVPTVCSKTQTLVEIYEDASLFVDPENIDEIGRNILKIMKDQSLSKELIKKGIILSNNFSWKKTANETYNIYKQVLDYE